MPQDEGADASRSEPLVRPPGQLKALLVIAGSQLLVLTLWFSASAVALQLEVEWGLTSGETAGLTIAVQIGFVLGALGSAVLALADVVPARLLFLLAGSVRERFVWAAGATCATGKL